MHSGGFRFILRQNFFYDTAVNICEAEVATLEGVGEAGVIYAELV